MAAILINCPTTQAQVSTGQHATIKEFHEGDFEGSFRCSSCAEIHAWTKPQARLALPLRER